MDEYRIKDIGTLLSAFFDEAKLRRGGRYAQFFESWRAVVGDRLASHSRVVDLDKGILIVEAEHPGWIQMLQLRQTKTLDELSARFPDLGLRGIAFRLAGSGHRAATSDAVDESDRSSVEQSAVGPDMRDVEEPEAATPPRDPEFTAALNSLKKAIQGGNRK